MTDLTVSGLTVEFSTAGYKVRALDGVDFAASSELVLVLGPSGSGKTTLLSCLAGILTPTSGAVIVGGTEIGQLSGPGLTAYRRHTVGIVFQSFNLIPSLSARDNVEAPLRLAGVGRRARRTKAEELLAQVGLTDRMHHRPAQLSGGQQQRVAIARALVHDAPLVIADEPTAHLDYVQVEGVLELLHDLAGAGRTVVIATHDERLLPLADRVVDLAPRTPASLGQDRFTLAKGDLLFAEHSRSDLVYVVERGKVELVRERHDGSEEVVRVAGPGQYFGELGPMFRLPRSASARARTAASVFGITVAEFRRRTSLNGHGHTNGNRGGSDVHDDQGHSAARRPG